MTEAIEQGFEGKIKAMTDNPKSHLINIRIYKEDSESIYWGNWMLCTLDGSRAVVEELTVFLSLSKRDLETIFEKHFFVDTIKWVKFL